MLEILQILLQIFLKLMCHLSPKNNSNLYIYIYIYIHTHTYEIIDIIENWVILEIL